MKVLSTWSIRPGALQEVVERYKAGKGTPGDGVKMLGRWHAVDFSCGFSLYETDDLPTLYKFFSTWADLLESKATPVVEDDVAAPVLIGLFKS